MLSRLMESHIWRPPAISVTFGERVQNRDNGLCLSFCLGESCPPALALMPNTLVPPHMPLVPFELVSWCWSSDEVSLSNFMCGFFKRNCLGLQKFLPLIQTLLVFTARSYGDLSSWHWNPGLGSLVWGWDSLLPTYPSQIFIHHKLMWGQSVLCLCPSYQSGWWFL